jgi:hypoxanthine phosphoribosyltransferase
MLTDDGKHLYVSWDEYHHLIERLALKVHASGWEFDQILCLARGGMRPGDILSRIFDRPLGIMVDDLADSGVTLRAVVDRLRSMPAITELRSAVIWVKGVSSYAPDYHVDSLPTSPWIHQPFEEYDGLRPEALLKKRGL